MKDFIDKTLSGIYAHALFSEGSYVPVRLDAVATDGTDVGSNDALERFIWSQFPVTTMGQVIGVGGYMEKRAIYQRASNGCSYNADGGELRNIHLALDFWTEADTTIYSPLDGVVHSMLYTTDVGQFGGCIVLAHDIEGIRFHSLYGHLSRNSVVDYEPNQAVKAGQALAKLGTSYENGWWPPHLHFQLILDMQGYEGDYVGVSAASALSFFSQNCPDPNLLLKINCLTESTSYL